jgi:hypothetical protein
MIVIERSELRNQLRQDLVAASYGSADAECCNQLAPLGNLCRALHHCTIVPTRLAKSIQEALALHESWGMNIQFGRDVHLVRICNPT